MVNLKTVYPVECFDQCVKIVSPARFGIGAAEGIHEFRLSPPGLVQARFPQIRRRQHGTRYGPVGRNPAPFPVKPVRQRMVDKAQRAPVIPRRVYIQHVHGFPDEPGEFHIQPVGSGHAPRRVTHGVPVGVKGGNGAAVADMDALPADKVKQGAQRITVPLQAGGPGEINHAFEHVGMHVDGLYIRPFSQAHLLRIQRGPGVPVKLLDEPHVTVRRFVHQEVKHATGPVQRFRLVRPQVIFRKTGKGVGVEIGILTRGTGRPVAMDGKIKAAVARVPKGTHKIFKALRRQVQVPPVPQPVTMRRGKAVNHADLHHQHLFRIVQANAPSVQPG
ncbi:MAG: hypothetical protein BWX80_03593 [Candidatus Hydrogenedentes bacterium ADurb.Bin101]|nr:MAG: hypothetical protein BWX80_03593 [Candidatus Hydrogenedentes bacterium ADurb.Bin101]